jgi:uncharacterized membrane protein YvlD (DUF360 family)
MLANPVLRFLLFWGVNTLSLWVADDLFEGISFSTAQSLLVCFCSLPGWCPVLS